MSEEVDEPEPTPTATPAPPSVEELCSNGDFNACYVAAVALEKGQRPDLTLAASRYERACNGGRAEACERLAEMFEWGRGVDRDWARAGGLKRRTADLRAKECEGGNWPVCRILAEDRQQAYESSGGWRSLDDAIAFFKRACDGGIGEACYKAAQDYKIGKGRLNAAADLYKKACAAGYAPGCDAYKKLSP